MSGYPEPPSVTASPVIYPMVSHRRHETGGQTGSSGGDSPPPTDQPCDRERSNHPDGGRGWAELTGFQRDLLKAIRRCGCEDRIPTGQTIKAHLERRYEGDINNGRLYQNLGALVDAGLLEKGFVDGRTNTYCLRPAAVTLLDETAHELADICEITISAEPGGGVGSVAQQ